MKIRLLASALLMVALIAPVVHAQDTDKDTELGKHMSKVGKDFKKLRASVKDAAQNDASIALLADMKTEFTAALDLKPEKEADLPADQQADFQAKYVAGLKEAMATIDKTTAALKAGDNDGAAKLVQDLFGEERKDHKQFKKPKAD